MRIGVRAQRLTAVVSLIGCLAGCGQPGVPKYRASGTVTYNGQPIPEGDISFIPSDTSRGPEAGRIVNGKYELYAHAGKANVAITAERATGRAPRNPMIPNTSESYIPAQYNLNTELEAYVTPDGSNTFDFKLIGEQKTLTQ